jgi:ACS family sodium-dependent inorganic phosphate cotransporter-like MFS transporter 5
VWTQTQQGLVLGSYFWGYLFTQVPGGRLAEMIGGKWIFFAAVVINIVCTLLGPVCAVAGYPYLILMRILMGLGGGLTFPAMNVLIAEWAPKQERSTISALIYGGNNRIMYKSF